MDFPTGALPAPLTVNGEPVFDISVPGEIRLAVIEPGRKYQLSQFAGGWAVTRSEPSEKKR